MTENNISEVNLRKCYKESCEQTWVLCSIINRLSIAVPYLDNNGAVVVANHAPWLSPEEIELIRRIQAGVEENVAHALPPSAESADFSS